MDNPFWLKQGSERPAFGDLLWSRPENKRSRGKLLIIGGRGEALAAPAKAYAAALTAGIGTARVVLPEAARKTLGQAVPEAEFAPSTASGGFGRAALASWLEQAEWADAVLLAGDFGNNSETALVLEAFTAKYDGRLSFAGDSLSYLLSHASSLARYNFVITTDFGWLQKLGSAAKLETPLKSSLDILQSVKLLADWTAQNKASFVTAHQQQIVVASHGRVSTTPSSKAVDWPALAAYASVWRLQNPTKPFAALTTAIFEYLIN